MANSPRYYNGLVSRFSAGGKTIVPLRMEAVKELKQLRGPDLKVHAGGVNLSADDLQRLIGLLRSHGIEVVADRVLSAGGPPLVIFSHTTLAPQSAMAIAAAANVAPAGRRVIDCEGYAYLSENVFG